MIKCAFKRGTFSRNLLIASILLMFLPVLIVFAGGLLARVGLFDVEYAPIYQASIFVLACVCFLRRHIRVG